MTPLLPYLICLVVSDIWAGPFRADLLTVLVALWNKCTANISQLWIQNF